MIQEHTSPLPQITPSHSPTELERAQHLAKLLEDKAKLEKSIQGEEDRVSKAKLAVSQAEDDLSILQQGALFKLMLITGRMMLGGRRIRVGGDDLEGVFVEEADSGEEVGVQADGGKRRKVG